MCFPAGCRRGGDGGSRAQKRASAPVPDAVGAKKKSSTPSTSYRSTLKKNYQRQPDGRENSPCPANSNVILCYGLDSLNAFAQQKDGSIEWIPKQIVGIGEDFHSHVDDGKVKTTLYEV